MSKVQPRFMRLREPHAPMAREERDKARERLAEIQREIVYVTEEYDRALLRWRELESEREEIERRLHP